MAWTPAIYICPEGMWNALLMFKVPAPPRHPGNLCYHLLWWAICWCYCRWWFRMCGLINELHVGLRNPAWMWITRSSKLGMATDINYIHFYVKFIQSSLVYWFHQSIKVFRYFWQLQNRVSGLEIWSGNLWNNDWVCEKAPGIHCSFAGFGTVWDGSVANRSPLEYQKCPQCWKTIIILFNAIYPFRVENIFLLSVIE